MSDATTLLFGLPGVRAERVERRDDGARVVHVVTNEETRSGVSEVWGGLYVGQGVFDHHAA